MTVSLLEEEISVEIIGVLMKHEMEVEEMAVVEIDSVDVFSAVLLWDNGLSCEMVDDGTDET